MRRASASRDGDHIRAPSPVSRAAGVSAVDNANSVRASPVATSIAAARLAAGPQVPQGASPIASTNSPRARRIRRFASESDAATASSPAAAPRALPPLLTAAAPSTAAATAVPAVTSTKPSPPVSVAPSTTTVATHVSGAGATASPTATLRMATTAAASADALLQQAADLERQAVHQANIMRAEADLLEQRARSEAAALRLQAAGLRPPAQPLPSSPLARPVVRSRAPSKEQLEQEATDAVLAQQMQIEEDKAAALTLMDHTPGDARRGSGPPPPPPRHPGHVDAADRVASGPVSPVRVSDRGAAEHKSPPDGVERGSLARLVVGDTGSPKSAAGHPAGILPGSPQSQLRPRGRSGSGHVVQGRPSLPMEIVSEAEDEDDSGHSGSGSLRRSSDVSSTEPFPRSRASSHIAGMAVLGGGVMLSVGTTPGLLPIDQRPTGDPAPGTRPRRHTILGTTGRVAGLGDDEPSASTAAALPRSPLGLGDHASSFHPVASADSRAATSSGEGAGAGAGAGAGEAGTRVGGGVDDNSGHAEPQHLPMPHTHHNMPSLESTLAPKERELLRMANDPEVAANMRAVEQLLQQDENMARALEAVLQDDAAVAKFLTDDGDADSVSGAVDLASLHRDLGEDTGAVAAVFSPTLAEPPTATAGSELPDPLQSSDDDTADPAALIAGGISDSDDDADDHDGPTGGGDGGDTVTPLASARGRSRAQSLRDTTDAFAGLGLELLPRMSPEEPEPSDAVVRRASLVFASTVTKLDPSSAARVGLLSVAGRGNSTPRQRAVRPRAASDMIGLS